PRCSTWPCACWSAATAVISRHPPLLPLTRPLMSSNQTLMRGAGLAHFLRHGLGAMAFTLLAGCMTVGPDYQPPAPEAVTLQAAADPAFSSASPVAAWWSGFDDPTLEQLVERALADNLDLSIAMTRVRTARALF